jgi:hypothetical protein
LLFINDTVAQSLYVSRDGGYNFTQVIASPVFTWSVTDMTIHGQVIYLTTGSAVEGVYISADGGANFVFNGTIGSINAITVDYRGRKYAASASSISFSDDGTIWTPTNSPGPNTITDLAIDHTGRLYVLATTPPSFVVSDDRGGTWFELYPGMSGTRMQVVEYHD